MRFTQALYVALAACSVVVALPSPITEAALAIRSTEIYDLSKRHEGNAGVEKRYAGDREDNLVEKRYEGDREDNKKRYAGDREDNLVEKRYAGDREDNRVKKRYEGDAEDK